MRVDMVGVFSFLEFLKMPFCVHGDRMDGWAWITMGVLFVILFVYVRTGRWRAIYMVYEPVITWPLVLFAR